MDDIFKGVGDAILWIIALFIGILAGVVWFMFQYWYIMVGAIVLWIIYVIVEFEVRNHRKFKRERQKLLEKKKDIY
ncbi:hypothetical protein CAPN008_11620 [Capnocytophaga canis]|uniref:hypothetical protein n=1 Tax=Capnocytophaga canis TaxID=1848903 RepID=UPI001ACA667A|nr:hypothetical protein [Capnocytophaga canis]GIM61112.1 hypothetical protein CAPN008_11620 [Capnocytophaga canis]